MTDNQAAKFAQWCQKVLGLEDWSVTLHIQDDPPGWVCDRTGLDLAACGANRQYKLSKIWVSKARCEADGSSPLAALGHEMLHVAASDTGAEADCESTPANEFLWTKLGDILADAYLAKVMR